jgi:hypothetical protein
VEGSPFRTRTEQTCKGIAADVGEANVEKFQDLIEQYRKA